MFWQKARKKYKNVGADDKDIQRYFEVAHKIQEESYEGIGGYIHDLGHKFISKFTKTGKVLEIGFGRGRQGIFFKGNPDNYYPVEISRTYIYSEIWQRFNNAIIADASHLPYKDDSFDKVVSIYNLEHIRDIHIIIQEVKRVLKKDGEFLVALPCEGGLAWNLGRELFTRRKFMKKYKINYDKVIAFEHVHNLKFLKNFLKKNFNIKKERFYPFFMPSINLNLIYCGIFKNNKK